MLDKNGPKSNKTSLIAPRTNPSTSIVHRERQGVGGSGSPYTYTFVGGTRMGEIDR